ncbi:hypothetical protein GCM10009105_07140 [Dokdonella soli]|uniref:Uncharacterized protein n=1 Tax=Dokdonella soli TaxID=529810 RepID=A0ABP3TM04_9GAMM
MRRLTSLAKPLAQPSQYLKRVCTNRLAEVEKLDYVDPSPASLEVANAVLRPTQQRRQVGLRKSRLFAQFPQKLGEKAVFFPVDGLRHGRSTEAAVEAIHISALPEKAVSCNTPHACSISSQIDSCVVASVTTALAHQR